MKEASATAQRVAVKTCYSGRRIRVDEETIELPRQNESAPARQTTLEIIRHPGAAAIVPLLDDGQVVLIRQYRYAADSWILEVPAGTLDDGEAPRQCAERELMEETGQHAARWSELGFVWTTPGFTDERIYLFLARDLSPVTQQLEDDELIEVVPVPLREAVAMVHDGRINDGKSIAALLRANELLHRQAL